MEKIISSILESIVMSKIYHTKTKLYSAHMALGSYYESMGDIYDSLVESYQGEYGIVENYEMEISKETQPVVYFESLSNKINMLKSGINPKDTYLLNQIDTVCQEIYSLLYKLKNLR